MSIIRGAVFDLDGTLLDSMNFWKDCGKDFVRAHGIEPEDGLSEKLYRMSMAQGAHYLKQTYFPSAIEEEISKGIELVLQDDYAKYIQLKDGAKETLDFLSSRGIPCALATATPEQLFRPALARLNIESYFCAVLTCPALNTSKETPLIYQKAAELLKTAPEETVVFEDALIPIRTAYEAGFFTAGVYDSSCGNDISKIREYSCVFLESLADFTETVKNGALVIAQ